MVFFGEFGSGGSGSVKIACYIVTSNCSIRRLVKLMFGWGYFWQSQPNFELYFLSIESDKLRSLKEFSVSIPPPYDEVLRRKSESEKSRRILADRPSFKLHLDLVGKDVAFAHHCCHVARADWCVRVTDDVFMNRRALPKFLNWLQGIPAPRSVPYVFGNCLEVLQSRWKIGWYLQGGSGYLFSRSAAKHFMDLAGPWTTGLFEGEDYQIVRALVKMNIRPEICNSGFFSGHFMRERHWYKWDWSSRLYFGKCPREDEISHGLCRHKIVPYHDVLFHHALGQFMSQRQWARWFAAVPENAMVYYHGIALRICKNRTN
jgi:hypothetical protein